MCAMKVPLVDLRASLTPIKDELFEQLEKTLEGMNLFLGPNVQALEHEFAEYCRVQHGIGVSSGTDALSLALRALHIGPGDEVIVPSLTFFASIEAIVHAGAVPVLVDVVADTLTIDPDKAGRLVSDATRAIMPVHLYGHPAAMDPILQIAGEHDLRVIEDCAQAHGARYKQRRCGAIGDAGAFSFYFTKNLGAYGEGGFVTTAHDDVAQRVRQLRHHGQVSKFEHASIGYNMRLDEMQAIILRLKLRSLDENNRRRVDNAGQYDRLLADSDIRVLQPRADSEPVYHAYPIRVKNRDALRDHLEAQGIGTGIHYKIAGHQQPALQQHPHRIGDMTVTESACQQLLSLPMYPQLTGEQIEYVAGQVLAFVRG